MTHDYKPQRNYHLVCRAHILDGKVIGTCMPDSTSGVAQVFAPLDQQTQKTRDSHHRRQLFDSQTSGSTELDEKDPRFHAHFTPTSASWLNMVERFSAT